MRTPVQVTGKKAQPAQGCGIDRPNPRKARRQQRRSFRDHTLPDVLGPGWEFLCARLTVPQGEQPGRCLDVFAHFSKPWFASFASEPWVGAWPSAGSILCRGAATVGVSGDSLSPDGSYNSTWGPACTEKILWTPKSPHLTGPSPRWALSP